MKRTLLAGYLTLVMLLSLTACGGSAKSESASSGGGMGNYKSESAVMEETTMDMSFSNSATEAPMEAPKAEAESGAQNSADIPADAKLIYTAHLNMETTDFDKTVAAVETLTDSMGGYFENSSLSNYRSGYRSAYYVVRVPAERYDAFLSQAGELCHLLNKEEYVENVTEFYYDTEGRLATQRTKLERLQELLSRAESMEDIITIESAISDTEWQIENLSGTLRHYDAMVDYATINVNINEVYKLSNVEEVPETFGDRMGDAFSDGLRDFGDGMEDLAVSFAYSWMWWLLAGVVVVVIVRVARKGKGKLPKLSLRKKKNDKQDEG